MTGSLTTHVLDTAAGRPAAGLRIELYRLDGDERVHIRTAVTNSDGRVDGQMLTAGEFRRGTYEILFHAGEYHARAGGRSAEHPFLDVVPVRFGMDEQQHYHVPLLLSPFGYSTYRGS